MIPLTLVFWHREEMFQNRHDALAQLRRKSIEDEVRIDERHRVDAFLDIVSRHHIRESEVGGRTVWQVRDNQRIRPTTRFMPNCEKIHGSIRK